MQIFNRSFSSVTNIILKRMQFVNFFLINYLKHKNIILAISVLVVIAGLPILFSKFTTLPTSVSIGGTGLLIVVGVALETYKQLEGSLLTRNYKKGYSRR